MESKQVTNQNIQNVSGIKDEIEKKFMKYKNERLRQKADPLTEIETNHEVNNQQGSAQREEIILGQCQINELIIYGQNEEKVMELLLGDAKLREISEQMKKEAEKKYREQLMKTFPERYKSLLEKQLYLTKLEQKHEALKNDHQRQIKSQINRNQQLENQLRNLKTKLELTEKKLFEFTNEQVQELKELLKSKDYQLSETKNQLATAYSRIQKNKIDYTNLNKLVVQLREQEGCLQKQNQRLVIRLQETEGKSEKGYKKILQLEAEIRVMRASVDRQLQDEKQKFRQIIQKKDQQLNSMNEKLEFKDSLIEMVENQKEKLLANYDQQEKRWHEQMQKAKQEHLDALKVINTLEASIQQSQNAFKNQKKINELEIQKLRKQLEDKYVMIGEYKMTIDAKQNFIFSLQQKISSMNEKHESDLHRESLKNTKLIDDFKEKYSAKIQELQSVNKMLLKEQVQFVEKVKQTQEQNNQDYKLIEEEIAIFTKNFTSENDVLEEKVKELSQINSYLARENKKLVEAAEQSKINEKEEQRDETGEKQLVDQLRVNKYEKIIEQLQKKVFETCENSKKENEKGQEMYRKLLEENKSLRKQLLEK